jgi:Holliday junction resolvasome RuvABC endonuclease subunit
LRTLYFDTATSTGWACGDVGGEPVWGSFELLRTGDEIYPFLRSFKLHIEKLVDVHRPERLAFEEPLLAASRDNATKLRKLYGLTIKVEEVAGERKLPCVECPASEVKAHWLGKKYPRQSDISKMMIRVEARKRGWQIKNSDEADALAGLDYLLTLDDPNHAIRKIQQIGPLLRR